MQSDQDSVMRVLKRFYPPKDLFFQEIETFSPEEMRIHASFAVAKTVKYSNFDLGYVALPQYTIALSQLAYSLVYLTSKHGKNTELIGDSADFVNLVEGGNLICRRIEIKFSLPTKKGDCFSLRMECKRIKKIGNTRLLLSFAATGCVEAKVEFVAQFKDG